VSYAVTSASSAQRPDAFAVAADIFDPPRTGVLAYRDDPAGFVNDCIKWEHGKGPTPYQLTNLRAIPEHKRVAVRGPHGLGKTAENAWVVLWFALTRDAEGADWKIPTTASAWRQLTHYLWPEIRKWSRVLDWDRIEREPFGRYELLQQNLKLRTGEAFAVACEDPATIEGVHADQVLYIYDEAKSIPGETFDASEGAFSGAGEDTDAEAFALASSTPGPPVGRFYEIHTRKPGLEDWHAIHVTLQDTIDAGRVSKSWAEQRKRQWGEKSAVYLNRVEGKFAASDEDSVIPLAWVEAAVERWKDLQVAEGLEQGWLKTVGADVARSGADKTVLALRYGGTISELRRYSEQGTMETTGQVAGLLRTDPNGRVRAVVDVIGIGAGVVDRLREQGFDTIAFNASERTDRIDKSGELGFVNCRSAAWWHLRELLDPDSGKEIALPDEDTLIGDLTAPTWRVMSGGKIQVESKEDIKKRLGRSTDDGDAVIQAFWPDAMTLSSGPPIVRTKRSRWKM
jgi:hypothetical protein